MNSLHITMTLTLHCAVLIDSDNGSRRDVAVLFIPGSVFPYNFAH